MYAETRSVFSIPRGCDRTVVRQSSTVRSPQAKFGKVRSTFIRSSVARSSSRSIFSRTGPVPRKTQVSTTNIQTMSPAAMRLKSPPRAVDWTRSGATLAYMSSHFISSDAGTAAQGAAASLGK